MLLIIELAFFMPSPLLLYRLSVQTFVPAKPGIKNKTMPRQDIVPREGGYDFFMP
jgi:hypothetical protein